LAFFCAFFGLGCGWGSRLPLGSRSFVFGSALGARDGFPVFQLRSRTFLLTMELLEVGIAVGLVHFVFSVESSILPLG
jgi:hypothetical protein